MSDKYDKITVEAATTGWILTRRGHPAEIFTLWHQLVARMETLLTSKGEKDEQ